MSAAPARAAPRERLVSNASATSNPATGRRAKFDPTQWALQRKQRIADASKLKAKLQVQKPHIYDPHVYADLTPSADTAVDAEDFRALDPEDPLAGEEAELSAAVAETAGRAEELPSSPGPVLD